jgi:hypothetical protein
LDFDRGLYRQACREQFLAYRECKQKWGKITHDVLHINKDDIMDKEVAVVDDVKP